MAVFALIFVRFLKRDSAIHIPSHLVFIQVIFVSLFFEWYLPNFSHKTGWYTADYFDVFMYFLGGVAFLFLQRRI